MGTTMAMVLQVIPADNEKMSVLSSILAKLKPAEPQVVFDALLRPEQPLFVIGDVHGCAGLLTDLMAQQPANSQLVFVGDLIDRGPNSAAVLAIVKEACDAGAICLAGNHEKMMLDFLDRPTERGGRWVRYGGLQTMESLAIGGIGTHSDEQSLLKSRDALSEKLGEEMIRWLRNLPKHWHSGNVHVVHAAADPIKPMDIQSDGVLMWGHPDFLKSNRADGQWVVFGHTVQKTPTSENGRISVDTGAFATGVLTAAYITQESVRFVST